MISLQLPVFSHNMIIDGKGFPTFSEVQRLNISWRAGLLLSALRTKQVSLPTTDTLMLIFFPPQSSGYTNFPLAMGAMTVGMAAVTELFGSLAPSS